MITDGGLEVLNSEDNLERSPGSRKVYEYSLHSGEKCYSTQKVRKYYTLMK